MSILSFPDRGNWGKSSWRGNMTGHVYRDLFERLQPKVFVDPMVGSGTSVEVAQEMGIEAYGLDLHSGFNILRDSIVSTVGKEADLVLSHPPYGNMVVYSGEVWGQPHPDDLSRCIDDEDFHQKLQLSMMNQREATRPGGIYGTIIGDRRKDGRYVSYQAEVISRLPSDELAAVVIKAQHNTTSARKSYGRMQMPMILHEYVVLFRRKERTVFGFLRTVAQQAQARLTGTWKNVVRSVLIGLGGKAALATIYQAVASNVDKVKDNPNWQAKVRQILNSNASLFVPVERGVWALA